MSSRPGVKFPRATRQIVGTGHAGGAIAENNSVHAKPCLLMACSLHRTRPRLPQAESVVVSRCAPAAIRGPGAARTLWGILACQGHRRRPQVTLTINWLADSYPGAEAQVVRRLQFRAAPAASAGGLGSDARGRAGRRVGHANSEA